MIARTRPPMGDKLGALCTGPMVLSASASDGRTTGGGSPLYGIATWVSTKHRASGSYELQGVSPIAQKGGTLKGEARPNGATPHYPLADGTVKVMGAIPRS